VFFRWLRRRKEARRLVHKNAAELIASFGDRAYFEAQDRAQRQKTTIGVNRPFGHRTRVKVEIPRMRGASFLLLYS
jgi:hypothetical protein